MMKKENLDKLTVVGKKFKNLKVMCEELDIEYKDSTDCRKAIRKEVEQYVRFKDVGRKRCLIVEEVYDTKIEKEDGRGKQEGSRNAIEIHYPNFKLDRCEWDSIGVYAIIEGSSVYVGSTTVGFRVRFHQHKDIKHNMLDTGYMIEKGAIFVALEICNNKSERYIRDREDYWIKEFCRDVDFTMVNRKQII